MANNDSMAFEDIEHDISIEIKAAQDNNNDRAGKREKSWDRYYGRKLGNEVKGRSQFITREVMDTVEWMMPYFIRSFAAGDPKIEIEIKGQEPWVGKAVMEKIQLDLNESTPNIFLLFYQWFKDALISDTAFTKVSWDLDQESVNIAFDELPADQMQQLVVDPDVTVSEAGTAIIRGSISQGSSGDIVFQDVKAKVKKTIKDTLYAENTPHWEFLADPKSRDVNDEYGKGHKTEVTVDYLKRINRAEGGDFFKHLDKLESGEGREQSAADEGESTSYMGEDSVDKDLNTETGPKSPVDFIEWYTRLDVDGDGYLENIVCYLGNGYLLKWEENEDGIIPFSSLKPIIDCYKFFGISYADLLVEIQNLKTMLFRRILDNFDFQNSGRWLRDPNSGIDTYALLNNAPGSVITGKVDGLKDITPAPFQTASLGILEYVDTVKENRTGVTKYNQGTDSDSLNKTARGIGMIQSAAMQRMDLIGRIFAEVGLKDFYRKCALLYQKHLRQPFISKTHGKEQEVTPEMLQGRVVCTVNMGVTASVGVEEAQRIEKMLGILFKTNEMFPGLLTPDKIHNIMRRYVTASGFKNADDFIGDLEEYTQKIEQARKQGEDTQKQMMELQQKFKEMEMQIKAQDSQTKTQKVQQDGVIASAELTQEKEIAIAEISQKDKDSIRDHKIDLLELAIKGTQTGMPR